MPNFSQLFGGGGVKGVQRGKTAPQSGYFSINVTISPVNPAKTMVNVLTQGYPGGENYSTIEAQLINSSQLEITSFRGNNKGFGPISTSWEVIEFN